MPRQRTRLHLRPAKADGWTRLSLSCTVPDSLPPSAFYELEYVLRHKRGLRPSAPPLRLGDPELDAIHLREPDLSVYDQLVPRPMTRDPGEIPAEEETP